MGVPTREEMRRRARNTVTSDECRVTSKQYLAYRDVPEWAKGLPLIGGAGMMTGNGPFARTPAKGTPRPVPFAFRRRR